MRFAAAGSGLLLRSSSFRAGQLFQWRRPLATATNSAPPAASEASARLDSAYFTGNGEYFKTLFAMNGLLDKYASRYSKFRAERRAAKDDDTKAATAKKGGAVRSVKWMKRDEVWIHSR